MKKEESPRIKELKHKSRRLSIKEGIFASVKSGLGDHYISPFAIAINASNSIIALLGAISGLLGPLSQMFSSRLIEKHSRKKIIMKAVFFEALTWLPLILIAFLFYKGVLINTLPILLLITISIYIILSNIAVPAWFSWIGEIVDENYRGRWFSKRQIITSIISGTLAVIASFFLDSLKEHGLSMIGFIIFFFIAFVARLISWKIFKKQYEPKIKLERGYYFSFINFLIETPKNNFGKFAIFRGLLAFGTSISSSLLAVYLLRNIGFDYTLYMVIILVHGIFSIGVLGLWGKFADIYGNYRVLCITITFIPIIPIFWILSPNPFYLLIVPSLISGVSWAGFNLAAGNFVYDNVTPQKRGLVISYYNMLIGIGTFLGAGLSAILIRFLADNIKPIFVIFIISSIISAIVSLLLVPKIKEIRKTEKFDSSKAIKNILLKEAKPALLEEVHEIMLIKEYLHEK